MERETVIKPERVGVGLRILNNRIRRYMDRFSHKSDIDKITGTNGWIIGYIMERAPEDVYQRDLEREFGITRSTASKVVDLMVRKGLIIKERVGSDARLKRLVLTEKSLVITECMKEDRERLGATLVKGFSEKEFRTLLGYIERMKSNIDER